MINWVNFQPPGEEQHNSTTGADTWGCTSFSAIHCIESQEIYKYGKTMEWSERALAKLSGTKPGVGCGVVAVANAIAKYGLILEKDWPSQVTTVDEFYSDIPAEVLAKAIPVDIELANAVASFDVGPMWTEMTLPNGAGHVVEQLSPTQYFDSYETYLKTFSPDQKIVWQGNLVFKGYKTMTNVKLIKNGSEYAFYVPATNEQALIDKALNFGYPLPKTNNGQNVDWANVKPDYTM